MPNKNPKQIVRKICNCLCEVHSFDSQCEAQSADTEYTQHTQSCGSTPKTEQNSVWLAKEFNSNWKKFYLLLFWGWFFFVFIQLMAKLLKRCVNLTLNLHFLFLFFPSTSHVSAWCLCFHGATFFFFVLRDAIGHYFYIALMLLLLLSCAFYQWSFCICGGVCVRYWLGSSLGIAGVFLICWVPFFSCNIMDAMCTIFGLQCSPGVTAFILTTWLGYMNR